MDLTFAYDYFISPTKLLKLLLNSQRKILFYQKDQSYFLWDEIKKFFFEID